MQKVRRTALVASKEPGAKAEAARAAHRFRRGRAWRWPCHFPHTFAIEFARLPDYSPDVAWLSFCNMAVADGEAQGHRVLNRDATRLARIGCFASTASTCEQGQCRTACKEEESLKKAEAESVRATCGVASACRTPPIRTTALPVASHRSIGRSSNAIGRPCPRRRHHPHPNRHAR